MKNLTKKYRLYAAYKDFSFIQLSNSRFGHGPLRRAEKCKNVTILPCILRNERARGGLLLKKTCYNPIFDSKSP